MGKAGKLRRKGEGKDTTGNVQQEMGVAVESKKDLKTRNSAPGRPAGDSLVKAVEAAKESKKAAANGGKKNETNPSAGEQGQKTFSGLIFMCNGSTKQDCFQYRVFGLPQGKRDLVEQVTVGMKLFLFDLDLRLLYGVYAATSIGGFRLEPEAFTRFKNGFPAQVRFRIFKDCLPLSEDVFRIAIQENYYEKNKFSCELSGKQVKNLIRLFRPVPRSWDNIDVEPEPLPRGLYERPFRAGYDELDVPNGRPRHQAPYIDPYSDLSYSGGVPENMPPPYGVDPVASEMERHRIEYLRDAPPDPYLAPSGVGYDELDVPNGRSRRQAPYIDPYSDLSYSGGVGVPEYMPPPYGVDPVASEMERNRIEYLRDAPPDPYLAPSGGYTRPLVRGLPEAVPEVGYDGSVNPGLEDPTLYRQRFQAYPDALGSYADISSERPRKRALEEVYLDERYLPPPKRAHLQQDGMPYSKVEYQRAAVAPQSSYADDRLLVSKYYAGVQDDRLLAPKHSAGGQDDRLLASKYYAGGQDDNLLASKYYAGGQDDNLLASKYYAEGQDDRLLAPKHSAGGQDDRLLASKYYAGGQDDRLLASKYYAGNQDDRLLASKYYVGGQW